MTAACYCNHLKFDGCYETMNPSTRNYIYIVVNCFNTYTVMTNVFSCVIMFGGQLLFQMNDAVFSSRVAGCLLWMAATQSTGI